MPAKLQIARSDMIAYIQSTVLGGMEKKRAYHDHIDPLVKDVYSAINRLEKRDDFIEILQSIVDTDELIAKRQMMRVKHKYVKMTETALDKATEVLEDASSKEEKAAAVRLANETFGAMGIIGVADPNSQRGPAVIDKKSHIL